MGLFPNKVKPKTAEEIEKIKESCNILVKALAHAAAILKPGMTELFLDKEVETVIRDLGGIPAFKGYNGFPAALCISVNNKVVHGIPTLYEFKDTDIVSVDCGVIKDGFVGDSAYTFAFNGVSEDVLQLLRVTDASLYLGIAQAKVGNRIGDIAFAIQDFVENKHGMGIVRELVGHGVGKKLHEPPDVPNFGKRGNGLRLEEGWTIAIEPMVNLGKRNVFQDKDGWTILTRDGSPSAHFEHTVVIRDGGGEILSDHAPILAQIKNNENIVNISENI